MDDLREAIDRLAAETNFSGAVRVDDGGTRQLAKAHGYAGRAEKIPNTVDTIFAIASGTKGITALAVLSLVDSGVLELATAARYLLGADLSLIDDTVTVEQLIAHRSGIGDYVDESADNDIDDHVLDVPVHGLASTEHYLAVLGGHPSAFPPGERFAYCNSGYVVLALLAERASGVPFANLVADRVCRPAGMPHAAFLRSDELPGGVATGYLAADGLRTNVFHLPVLGGGDGGMYATVADFAALWPALFATRIVSPAPTAEAVRPRSDVSDESMRYGLGFWLHRSSDIVMLEGYDAGVSFRSVHDPVRGRTHTVVSNTSAGAWPITRELDRLLIE